MTVLCDEYLAAIVIPTLQTWQEVFVLVDWNHSGSLDVLELKQGLCACNTPEGGCVCGILLCFCGPTDPD